MCVCVCEQLKSQLLDGTQESFTATVSKLSMIEQELEMLKIGTRTDSLTHALSHAFIH